METSILSLLGLVLLVALMAGPVPWSQPADSQSSRWGKSYLPNVAVLDQDHRPLRFYDDLLKGKIVVISFIYTSCRSICPLTLARLAEVQERLGDTMGRDIHFLSISIDPIPDTPDKLKEHARAFGAGQGWTFVTGDPLDIDLIRHKLGERSGSAIAQHKNEVLMYNDRTGEWSRDSAFADLGVLTMNIRSMNPEWRAEATPADEMPEETAIHAPDVTGQALFIKACASCHSVGGGRKIGPDLAGVTSRRTHEWVTAYLIAPDRLRASNDSIALDLRRQYPGVMMPTLGLSEHDAADIISFLESKP
ncbi:MAG: SCO family protein [Hyphomicrobium sp.]